MPLKPAFQPLAASKYPNSRLKHSELKNHQPLQPQSHLQQHRANHDSSGSNMIYIYLGIHVNFTNFLSEKFKLNSWLKITCANEKNQFHRFFIFGISRIIYINSRIFPWNWFIFFISRFFLAFFSDMQKKISWNL